MTQEKDAHKIALEWVKHIVTLSSGIIVFSGTFIASIGNVTRWSLSILGVSWLLLVLAIIFALETVSRITHSRIHDNEDWAKGTGRSMARAAKWCFVAGISLFVVFAGANVIAASSP